MATNVNHPSRRDYRRWEALRLQVFERDGWRCRACGKAGRLELDHVTPLHRGGDEWDAANLQALCRGCHLAKTASERERPDPERDAWRRLLAAQ